MTAASRAIDPITLEMYWRRMVSIVGELGSTLRRTSFSTVVRDIGDYGCAIFDARARLLAQTPDSTPGLCGPLGAMLNRFLEAIPPATLVEGDVLIGNDPWAGSGHHNDVSIMLPVFHRAKLIGYVMTCCHHVDIGGRRATTESRDNYEEGLRIPMLKFHRAGEMNTDVLAFIQSNVRSSETVVGDLGAQVAACHVGSERMRELCTELGAPDLQALADEIVARSEEVTRSEIRKLRKGTFSHDAQVDIVGGQTLLIRTTVTITDDEIVVDYSGSSPQVAPAINCTLTYTSAYTVFGILCMLDLPVAVNEGTLRPIRVVAEEGSVLNCRFPAPVFGRTAIGTFLPDFVYQAIAPAAPERICAEAGATPMWGQYMFGKRSDGENFAPFNVSSGGLGARAHRDGVSCLAFPYNVGNTPAEVVESEVPVLVEERSLWQDSAGPGQFRGGLGQRYVLRLLDGDLGPSGDVLASFRGGRFIHPPLGVLGGGSAPRGFLSIRGDQQDAGKQVVLRAGDRIVSQIPGGGGYGDPRQRSREAVKRDLQDGLISAEHARTQYGYEPTL
ncbi:hydantoinase B/oxoprolinase family protein [Ramlibacter albus]|uniref:Hydantoinase B/oxoprolinase family protein n=1 Tax=Ramlibacter albus TaxID=2079448 RepID=A0A923MEA7_9BURK|nr:hydantoinase B/oxoprolinase family protein [Ramlibacter albus]MBC5767859.1 hydantoinase B/oxoprolinase family protein [Ramlibacter albus]